MTKNHQDYLYLILKKKNSRLIPNSWPCCILPSLCELWRRYRSRCTTNTFLLHLPTFCEMFLNYFTLDVTTILFFLFQSISSTTFGGHCGWWEESSSWATIFSTVSRHRLKTDAEDHVVEKRCSSRFCFLQPGITVKLSLFLSQTASWKKNVQWMSFDDYSHCVGKRAGTVVTFSTTVSNRFVRYKMCLRCTMLIV